MSSHALPKAAPPWGVGYVLAFNLLSGIQAAYLSGLLQQANLFATIAVTFTLVGAFFLVASALRRRQGPAPFRWKEVAPDLLAINLTTAGSWLGFFGALKFVEPAVVSALANAVGPLLTLFITTAVLKSERLSRHEIVAALGVLACMLMMVGTLYAGKGALGEMAPGQVFLGVAMSLLCGLSMVLNTIVSKRLNNRGVEPHAIMKFRFVLIVLVAYAVAGRDQTVATLQAHGGALLLVAFVGNLVPLYVLQVGISKVPPLVVSFALVLAPLFYFGAQQFNSRLSFSAPTLLFIVLSLLCLSYGIFAKSRRA